MAEAEITLLFVAYAIILLSALHRAATDWPYCLRLLRVFELIEMSESPRQQFDVLEVVLVDLAPSSTTRSITFTRTDSSDQVLELLLDRPLGEEADLCEGWSAAGTPLLYVNDGSGGAVLQGPTACLVGHVNAPIFPFADYT